MKEKGFILLGILFMMVLMAITAVALNRRAGLQVRMASNQIHAVQTCYAEIAAIEHAIWQLTNDPCWRTSTSGEVYTYNGTTYNRKVHNSTLSGYTDAITVSVTAQGAANPLTTSFRYHIDTPFLVRKPNQVCRDSSDNIYFADSDNHSICKIDATTEAITRVAGDGLSGYSGDGGLATEARLDSPHGVALDSLGNIYIADTKNNCIRKVDAFGNIATVAGKGLAGYTGDGGPATNAKLNKPRGVFVDASGDIYIADTDNHRIRKVDAGTQQISTVAGTGSGGFSGDGGPATSAELKGPEGVFVDESGNIFIADTDNHCIRKVDAATQEINTVAGIGGSSGFEGDGGPATSAKLNNPRGVFVDTSGDIYIADTDNHRIRKVDAGTQQISTVAGSGSGGFSGDGGAATSAKLENPEGVYVDSNGNIFIADTGNHRLRVVSTHDGKINTIGGRPTFFGGFNGDNKPATDAYLNDPKAAAMASTRGGRGIYISDTENNRIRMLTFKIERVLY